MAEAQGALLPFAIRYSLLAILHALATAAHHLAHHHRDPRVARRAAQGAAARTIRRTDTSLLPPALSLLPRRGEAARPHGGGRMRQGEFRQARRALPRADREGISRSQKREGTAGWAEAERSDAVPHRDLSKQTPPPLTPAQVLRAGEGNPAAVPANKGDHHA